MDKAEKRISTGGFASIAQRVPGGGLLLAIISLVVLGYFGWYYYGADHLDQALYSLQLQKLTVTPQPAWIKSNVTQEVFHNGRLDRISLLEPRANAAIAQAFETHNWVESTTRVSKAVGGKVIVDLVYRRPVAMVYSTKGFYPVDDAGTVLPTQDFTREDVPNHFMIIAERATPAGTTGMPYGDVRITQALALCALLDKHRAAYGLQEIWVSHDGLSSGPSPWTLSIINKDKTREIVWGSAPGLESSGELPAEEKLKRMLAWLEESDSPTNAEPKKLDLRQATLVAPISAHRH